VATISPAATEGSDVVFNFTLSNPSDKDITYTFVPGLMVADADHYQMFW
jgi:hypothetical protein